MDSDLKSRYNELSHYLIKAINEEGFWTGELSPSALGVAVAVAALHFDNKNGNRQEIHAGLKWLTEHINDDGSFGDTPESPGNISTTLLVCAAVNLYAKDEEAMTRLQEKIFRYLLKNGIDIRSGRVAETILAYYKNDFTFSVPILTMCALCGIPDKNAFRSIPQLPFELSLLPSKFYKLLNLSVVSYAIPALIAVGIVICKKKESWPLYKYIRSLSVKRSLTVLHRMTPESGGYLEAIPLTAFVSLSLIKAGFGENDIVKKGISFLKRTQRPDGSWPIDIDLSTWVTTLSIKSVRFSQDEIITPAMNEKLYSYLSSRQNKRIHPFNGTGAGGWGWTGYSGSVPDCDDTPGAILALLRLRPANEVKNEVLAGSKWLMELQNKDGGFPTFSKGWGKLPFDQSCADLTGHALLALSTARSEFNSEIQAGDIRKLDNSIIRAVKYLYTRQNADGSFLPLWFGNQFTPDHTNKVYGTARVVTYLSDIPAKDLFDESCGHKLQKMITKGQKFLLQARNSDGSWGGDSGVAGSIEETALAISALTGTDHAYECNEGFKWLDRYYKCFGLKPSPIGLYFASLWYHEKFYPLTAYLESLSRTLLLNSGEINGINRRN